MKPFTKFLLMGLIIAIIGIAMVWFGTTSQAGIFSLLSFGLGFIAVLVGGMLPVLASIKYKDETVQPGKLRKRE